MRVSGFDSLSHGRGRQVDPSPPATMKKSDDLWDTVLATQKPWPNMAKQEPGSIREKEGMTESIIHRVWQIGVVLTLVLISPAWTQESVPNTPWWEQHKICYFWQPWFNWDRLGGSDTSSGDVAPVSNEDLIRELAGAGATVFVDRQDWTFYRDIKDRTPGYKEDYYGQTRPAILNRARLARKYGLRYFGHLHYDRVTGVAEKIGARLAVNYKGKTSKELPSAGGKYVPCPLDEKALDEWLFKYALDMARSGVVDGCHMDFELVAESFGEMGDSSCYCDDCFGRYGQRNGLNEQVARRDRYDWLNEKGRLRDYLTYQGNRLRGLFRRGAERVRAVKPDFVFGAYPGFMPGDLERSWRFEGMALGLNSPTVPFFVVDQMHYEMNHDAPWWHTGYARVRKLGMKLIPWILGRGNFGGGSRNWMSARPSGSTMQLSRMTGTGCGHRASGALRTTPSTARRADVFVPPSAGSGTSCSKAHGIPRLSPPLNSRAIPCSPGTSSRGPTILASATSCTSTT